MSTCTHRTFVANVSALSTSFMVAKAVPSNKDAAMRLHRARRDSSLVPDFATSPGYFAQISAFCAFENLCTTNAAYYWRIIYQGQLQGMHTVWFDCRFFSMNLSSCCSSRNPFFFASPSDAYLPTNCLDVYNMPINMWMPTRHVCALT